MNNIDMDKLLEECAEEEIHLIGEIQDFACLVAFDQEFNIKVLSENFDLLGKDLGLGKNLREYLSKEDVETLENFIHHESLFNESLLTLRINNNRKTFYCYKTKDLVVLEHESLKEKQEEVSTSYLVSSFVKTAKVSEGERGLFALAQNLAETIRSAIQYDRVMVYKFHEDHHGEVIAESKEDHLESFLKLHYPASDIPKQARELFLKNQIRIIHNVNGPRIPLISQGNLELDLSDSISRHSSVVHIEYLKNMGVSASLTISIIVDGKLWGLIACHHYSPKFISYQTRTFLRVVGFAFSNQVSKLMTQSLANRFSLVNMITSSLINEIQSQTDIMKLGFLKNIMAPYAQNILDLVGATGVYIEIGRRKVSFGNVPKKEVLASLHTKILESRDLQTFATNSLQSFGFDVDVKKCAGVLGLGQATEELGCVVMWFRPEVEQEIKWAGKDDKTVVYDKGHPRLSPRGSFNEITKLEQGKSLFFTDQDIQVGGEFAWFLSKVLLEQLKASEVTINSLEKEASQKDRFISNLSHELRTPINNILGWLQLYQDKICSDDDLKEFYDVVESSSKQQLHLVNDLLDASKISRGKLELSLEPKDIRDYIRKIGLYFSPSFKAKNIHFETKLTKNKITCSIDPVRFEQVIRNILHNALKFTPKNGTIKIEAYQDQSDAVIKVTDSGIGIEKSELKSVTNTFYQTDSSRSRSKEGLGLGLSLVKNIIELHGGSVGLNSEGKNKGTVVTLRLPISSMVAIDSDRPVASNFKKATQYFDNLKILLVEDTVESARFVKVVLEREGAEVVWTSNATDALRALDISNFDLVISDIGLPGMDGLEFIEKAKEDSEIAKIPFLALSAYGTPSEMSRSLEAGYVHHVVKPFKFDDFINTIKKALH